MLKQYNQGTLSANTTFIKEVGGKSLFEVNSKDNKQGTEPHY